MGRRARTERRPLSLGAGVALLGLVITASACSSGGGASSGPSGGTGAGTRGVDPSCVIVDMAVSPEKVTLLTDLAETFNASGTKVGDRCAAVRVARKSSGAAATLLACDALLDQDVFAGVGNIIKNEVLFRIRLHPLSTIGALPSRKLGQLIREARQYSFDFLEWKQAFVLKKHWLAHTKRTCPRCQIPFLKAHLGRSNRRSFYCERCQVRYG